jgi:hypothetical protein
MADIHEINQQTASALSCLDKGWQLSAEVEDTRVAVTDMLSGMLSTLREVDLDALHQEFIILKDKASTGGDAIMCAHDELQALHTDSRHITAASELTSKAAWELDGKTDSMKGVAYAMHDELAAVRTELANIIDRVAVMAMNASMAETHTTASVNANRKAYTEIVHYRASVIGNPE